MQTTEGGEAHHVVSAELSVCDRASFSEAGTFKKMRNALRSASRWGTRKRQTFAYGMFPCAFAVVL